MDESTHTDRFWWSTCDTRYKGHIVLPALASQATLPTITAVTATDLGFENWNDANVPTDWTEDVAAEFQRSGTVREGTYSGLVNCGAAGGGGYSLIVHQSQAWVDEYKNRPFTWKQYAKTNTAAFARIAIYDGDTRTYGTIHTGGNTWEELEVTKLLATGATELTLEIYGDRSKTASCNFDGGTFIPPTTGSVATWANFNGVLYVAHNNNIYGLAS